MFGMVLSYTMTVIGLFILRWRRPDFPRPYRCAGYPWLPAIYVLIGGAWTLNTIVTRPMEPSGGTAIMLINVPGYLYWKRMSRNAAPKFLTYLADLGGILSGFGLERS